MSKLDYHLIVPELDPSMAATEIVQPVATWGSIARTRPMPGTYHFYTDDKNFSALWKNPDQILASGCVVAVEPNYSTSDEMSTDDVIAGIYRKRVLAKHWQSQGIRILVDLNIVENHLYDVGLIGVPKGWKAYAIRSHRDFPMTAIDEARAFAAEHAGTPDILFAVFGGGKKTSEACKERGYIHLPEHMDTIKL